MRAWVTAGAPRSLVVPHCSLRIHLEQWVGELLDPWLPLGELLAPSWRAAGSLLALQVERTWEDVWRGLPAPAYRHRYGT